MKCGKVFGDGQFAAIMTRGSNGLRIGILFVWEIVIGYLAIPVLVQNITYSVWQSCQSDVMSKYDKMQIHLILVGGLILNDGNALKRYRRRLRKMSKT